MIRRFLIVGALTLAIAGCGHADSHTPRGELQSYLARVEPIRLAVNHLLDGADPALAAYREHRIGARAAQRRLGQIERRFAAAAVRIAALGPVPASLRDAQRSYAHTFVLEDAYLSALVAALPERAFDELPDTQNQQRAAIVAWRVRVEVMARKVGLKLPADLQAAGRGEIAPSPSGS